MVTRRQLITLSAAGAAAAATRAYLADPAALAPLRAERPWDAVRKAFDFAHAQDPRIPMNAANLAPAPTAVREAVNDAARRLDADESFQHRLLFLGTELHRARRLLAAQLGLRSGDDVALVRNTSEANSIVVNGHDLKPDDEVAIWNENHHSNNRNWGYRRARTPFVLRAVRLPERPRDAQEIVDAFVGALTPKTRVVSFTHISNISGLRLPAAALCRAIHARRPDVFVHVDGAQSWGSVALDLAHMDCDSYSASAHKWLCGPREIGILYVRREWAARLWPATLGYDAAFDFPEERLPDDARRFDCLGQRNDALLPGLSTALEFHAALGAERVERRVAELAAGLRTRLEALGARTIGPADPAFAHGVVVADLGGGDARRVFRTLYEHHGVYGAFVHGNRIVGAPDAVDESAGRLRLRLCPHIYNNEDDLDRAAQAVGQAIA